MAPNGYSMVMMMMMIVVVVMVSKPCPAGGRPGGIGPPMPIPVINKKSRLVHLARFAVRRHNNATHVKLKYVRLVSVKTQVVAGIMYYLTIEAKSGHQNHQYEAKVWVKEWQHFKQLQSFTLLH